MLTAWILLSIPVVVMGTAAFHNKEKDDWSVSFRAAAFFFLPLWWGIYFLIKTGG
jgi:hypothetical protein